MVALKLVKALAVMSVVAFALCVLSGCEGGNNPSGGGGVSGSFNDARDGKTYKTVKIGGQTWMAENLNYVADSSWCYGNSVDSCSKYGRLYDWNTAMGGKPSSSASPSGVQGVCPSGWHLPSREEWTALVDYAGGWETAGTKLKSKSGWASSDSGIPAGTDDYGFSALPGGIRGDAGGFGGAGSYGDWWTATGNISGNAYYRNINYSRENVSEDNYAKSNGRSVRCVQD